MSISYQHANPHHGNESYVLRFASGVEDQTVCVLVDAGDGVDLDRLLEPDEYLSAIVVTHGHLDHYQNLSDVLRDGAPVYAAPDTVEVLSSVLPESARHFDIGDPEAVLDALTPVEEWTRLAGDVWIHPLPAGHAPGAAGFLFQYADGDQYRHVLATGDFTERRVAGYPGLQTELEPSIDVLLLTAAHTDTFSETLTDIITTVVERARAGSTVVLATSGLTGIQLAYLLGWLGTEELDPIPVTAVGHVAKLYDRLDYDVPNVETVHEFADPNSVLSAGGVTIAGPEVPVEGSTKQLFDAIETDGSATLVQVTGGATEPVGTASCTVYDFQLSNHPTVETIDGVVEAYSPIHVVIAHQRGREADPFKDKYDSYVWATGDDDEQLLYEDGEWVAPYWVNEPTKQRVRANRTFGDSFIGEPTTLDRPELPPISRERDPDLVAEGLNVDAVTEQIGGVTGAAPDSPTASESRSSAASSTETDPETVEADAETAEATIDDSSIGARLDDVIERLDRIESATGGRRIDCRVVDAGDGDVFLRPDEQLDDVTHGETVTLVVPDREMD